MRVSKLIQHINRQAAAEDDVLSTIAEVMAKNSFKPTYKATLFSSLSGKGYTQTFSSNKYSRSMPIDTAAEAKLKKDLTAKFGSGVHSVTEPSGSKYVHVIRSNNPKFLITVELPDRLEVKVMTS